MEMFDLSLNGCMRDVSETLAVALLIWHEMDQIKLMQLLCLLILSVTRNHYVGVW